jgi:hypothetical protein
MSKAPTPPGKDQLILANMEQLMRNVIAIRQLLEKLAKHIGVKDEKAQS